MAISMADIKALRQRTGAGILDCKKALTENDGSVDAAIDWLLHTSHEFRPLEEAILGIIGSIDKPSSPAGEAKQHFHNRLYGRSHQQREEFRRHVLEVTLDDLRRVTETYLKPELASTAVIVPAGQREATASLCARLHLEVREL